MRARPTSGSSAALSRLVRLVLPVLARRAGSPSLSRPLGRHRPFHIAVPVTLMSNLASPTPAAAVVVVVAEHAHEPCNFRIATLVPGSLVARLLRRVLESAPGHCPTYSRASKRLDGRGVTATALVPDALAAQGTTRSLVALPPLRVASPLRSPTSSRASPADHRTPPHPRSPAAPRSRAPHLDFSAPRSTPALVRLEHPRLKLRSSSMAGPYDYP